MTTNKSTEHKVSSSKVRQNNNKTRNDDSAHVCICFCVCFCNQIIYTINIWHIIKYRKHQNIL